MDIDATIATIETIVKTFAVDSGTLAHLKRGKVERTITTDLAASLKPTFESGGVKVDAFYNKRLNATKRLNGNVIELDIAIHERGVDELNLVAIELETTNTPKRDDVWKLRGLTRPLGGYGYRLGLLVVFAVGAKAGQITVLEWYRDGRRLRRRPG